MNGLQGLEETARKLFQANHKSNDAIQRGQIHGNTVTIGARSYSYTLAVDVNVCDGMYVWANVYCGTAVIVGV